MYMSLKHTRLLVVYFIFTTLQITDYLLQFWTNAPKPSHPSETSLENCLGGCCLWIFTAAKDSVPSWIQARDRWTNIRKTLGPADPTQTTCCLQSCTVVNLSTTEHAHTELYDYMCSFTQTDCAYVFLSSFPLIWNCIEQSSTCAHKHKLYIAS